MRIERPRFVVQMIEENDGSWHAGEIKATDPVTRGHVTRLMSEAGQAR